MACTRRLLLAFLLLVVLLQVQGRPASRRSRAAKLLGSPQEESARETKLTTEFKQTTSTSPAPPSRRRNKALNFFGFFPSFLSSGLDYNEDDDDDVTFSVNDDNFDEDDFSRTIPSRRPQKKKPANKPAPVSANVNSNVNGYQGGDVNSLSYDNSPIFYIRLPPTPYMFVPGLGYVSQPPNMGPPMAPPVPQDPFINLPLDFVSNGKPTGVYQWGAAPEYQVPQVPIDPYGFGEPVIPQQRPTYTPPYSKPKPTTNNSKVTNLKGQYVFNGKPNDSVYVMRDTYNSIYSDALQNFYP